MHMHMHMHMHIYVCAPESSVAGPLVLNLKKTGAVPCLPRLIMTRDLSVTAPRRSRSLIDSTECGSGGPLGLPCRRTRKLFAQSAWTRPLWPEVLRGGRGRVEWRAVWRGVV